jgi:hypothetical protein
MIKREIEKTLFELSASYPVVTITGPRQSGKTTLVKAAFPNHRYFSMEDPDVRLKAITDPRSFLLTSGMALDEIQKAPVLLSYMQGIVDEHQKPGMFILSGSQNLLLARSVSQSLAGRTALLTLLPFSISELSGSASVLSLDEMLLKGFYPRIHDRNLDPVKAYKDYFETYIQRDLHELIHIKDLHSFQKFVKLCAGRIGSLFSASSLANEIGITVATVNSWISVLQASYITFFLEPYFVNKGKRLIKSPKLYFYDVGLAAYLLGMEKMSHLENDPHRGALFENLVVVELLKKRMNRGLDSNMNFYRDSNGNEVDVLLHEGSRLTPVEIKSAATFTTEFLKGITAFRKVFSDEAQGGFIVYSGETQRGVSGIDLVNFRDCQTIGNQSP